MTALGYLMAQGLTVTLVDGAVAVSPAALLTPMLRTYTRRNLGAIKAALRGDGPAWLATPRVTCGSCRNHQPDELNAAQGVGACDHDNGRGPSLRPLVPRVCRYWLARAEA